MAKVTAKENFMKLCKGGHPDYVPVYTMMGMPYLGECADAMMAPPIFGQGGPGAGVDMWGVPSKAPSTGVAASMPDTSFILLHDIEDWSKVIKFPKANDIDLDRVYQETLKKVDRSQSCLKVGIFRLQRLLVGSELLDDGLLFVELTLQVCYLRLCRLTTGFQQLGQFSQVGNQLTKGNTHDEILRAKIIFFC